MEHNRNSEEISVSVLFTQHGTRITRPYVRLKDLVYMLNHRNMQHGTTEERALLNEIERIKNILRNLGMSNAQIESTIQFTINNSTRSRRAIHDTDLRLYFTPELAERTRREQEPEPDRELPEYLEREQEVGRLIHRRTDQNINQQQHQE